MRKKLLYPLLASCLFACSDKDTSYEVVKNDLRAPAYPLVTIDPYASAWSMSDNLYDSPVRHWTGKDFPLIGVVKVDGVSYRFMGTEELEMNAIVPTSQQGDWTGRYITDKPAGDWTSADYNDSGWKSDRGAFGTKENEPTAKTQWGTRNIWVRRTVNIDRDLTGIPVYLEFSNDDDAVFYINGVKIHSTTSLPPSVSIRSATVCSTSACRFRNIRKPCLATQPCRPLPTCSPCRHTTLLPVVMST